MGPTDTTLVRIAFAKRKKKSYRELARLTRGEREKFQRSLALFPFGGGVIVIKPNFGGPPARRLLCSSIKDKLGVFARALRLDARA